MQTIHPSPSSALHPMRTAALTTLATCALWAPTLTAQDDAANAVTVADCRNWLGTLAGPGFEGRGTGQDGFQKAADYVAAHFKKLGFEARGEDGSYFQHVPWTRTTVTAASLTLTGDDGAALLTIPADNMIGTATQDTDAAGAAVLLTITPKDAGPRRMPKIEGLDDIDVTDKVVFVNVRSSGRAAAIARFAVRRALSGKNAAAVIYCGSEPTKGGLTGTSGMDRGGGNPAATARNRRPADISIGGAQFQKLLALAKLDADALDAAPLATPLPGRARLMIQTTSEAAPAMNVFGVLPGSDPELKDEYVVIGSHLDHLGRRGDTIFPGADDDGSGTTGVMAVAQMFAALPKAPRRSVLFVCFSGEERGLLGSSYFAKNCPVPLSQIAAELQMDMIGRDEEESRDGGRLVNVGETAEDNKNVVHLVGTQKLSRDLHELCMKKNEAAGFDIEFDQESLFTRSDHANFAYEGVPIAFFFTGIHKDYHQPSDTPDKINYEKLLRIARWVFDIGYDVAAADERPLVDQELWDAFKATDRRGRMPAAPAAPVRKD